MRLLFLALLLLPAFAFGTPAHADPGEICTEDASVCEADERCYCSNGACETKECTPNSVFEEGEACGGEGQPECDEIVVTASRGGGTTFREWANGPVTVFVDWLVRLLYAIAFLFFLYGMARFFFSTNEENRKKGREFAIWGIIGFVVLFGLWGIVKVLLSLLGG